MTRAARALLFLAFVLLLPESRPAGAQGAQPLTGNQKESRIHADFRKEANGLASCKHFDFGSIGGCAETLFTGQPLHIAVGSIAPQNGIGFGLAFSEHSHPTHCPWWINFTPRPAGGAQTSCNWRGNFNLDAVATGNGSWRAGAYINAYRLPGGLATRNAPVLDLYSQTTSLNRVYFYGLGPGTTPAARTAFGITQNITGTQVFLPLPNQTKFKINLGILAELNGRFPQLRGNQHESSPSIEKLYTEATAPGLSHQPAFLQLGEGIRLTPHLFNNRLRLNYLGQFQQFVAPSDSHYSFRRWTTDLNHEFALYRLSSLVAADPKIGPDSCSLESDRGCPHISRSLNLEGSISVRLLMTGSIAGAGSVVPFYFDPTIGGSDINNQSILASYPDYRFRAPNLLLLRETFEHSLGKFPVGFLFSIDEAKVGLRRNDISFDHLQHTFTTGLTLHAGGLPAVYALFSWGGNEGHHTAATISNALLGASARPSLF